MLDAQLRRRSAPLVEGLAGPLHRRGASAAGLTVAGLVLGLAAAVSAAAGWWGPTLILWLTSRLLDGVDGAVARLEGATGRGGFLDLMADFTVYASFIGGVAVAVPDARLAAVAVLIAYYLSGSAFLGWSAAAERDRGDRPGPELRLDDDRTVRFVGGLAEGFETIVAYAAICLMPDKAELILWVFAAMVLVTAGQRVHFAVHDLADVDRR